MNKDIVIIVCTVVHPSVIKILLNAYSMSDIVLNAKDTAINKTTEVADLLVDK